MAIQVTVAATNLDPLGDGPLTSATSASHTARLSKAGEVSVALPAADPRAVLLHKYARLLINADYGGGQSRAATGIVDRLDAAAGNAALLTASGGDLLRELQYTIARGLVIHEIATTSASRVEIIDPNASGYLVPEATDGDPATSYTVTLGPRAWLYVLRPYAFDRMEFDIDAATGADGMTSGRWQAFVEADGWVDVGISADTTNGLTNSGYVEWTPPADETLAAHIDNNYFAMRLIWTDPADTGPTVTLAEVRTRGIAPTTQGFTQVLALADGWALSDDWYQTSSLPVLVDCANNSLLWCLVELEARTGDQWRLAADGTKTIELLRKDKPDSGVTALGWLGINSYTNAEVCVLASLTQVEDYSNEVTRIFPYGAGSGAGRLSLAAATLVMPAGYAMNTLENYIERANVQQVIEREVTFREIEPVGGASPAADEIAANQLAQTALNYLQLRDGSIRYVAYSASVSGNHAPLRVGDWLRIVWRSAGLNVDARLLILEAQEGFDVASVQSNLTLATLARLPQTEESIIARQVAKLSAASGYAQPLPRAAIQRVVRGENLVTQIVTSAGGKPTVDPNDAASLAAAFKGLGFIKY